MKCLFQRQQAIMLAISAEDKMRKLLLGIFLSGCAWTDGKKREINLFWILLWSVLGSIYLIAGLWGVGLLDWKVGLLRRASGVLIGIFLLLVSFISKGQVGMGDGLVFLVCGLFLDFWESSVLLMGGLLLLLLRCLLSFFKEWRNVKLCLKTTCLRVSHILVIYVKLNRR